MPLQQSITDKSGVVTTYWVVTSIHADMVNENVSITLSGWLTSETYAAGSQASARRPYFFNIPFTSIPSAETGSIALTEIYTALLAIVNNPAKPSPFAGAVLVA
jgi:hypothetical protein